MRYTPPTVLTLWIVCLLCSCAPAKPNVLSYPIESEAFSQYYFEAKGSFEFFLRPEYAKRTKHFNKQEASMLLKNEGGVGYQAVSTEWSYYEVGRFYIGNHTYVLIMYNYPGDFDDPYLNIQLNSYTQQGEILDSVLLDARYHFEDIEVYSTFTIDNGSIFIKRYVGYYWDATRLIPGTVSTPVFQLYCTLTYAIDKGNFNLIAKKEYEAGFINESREK